jgi:hypothetical protein
MYTVQHDINQELETNAVQLCVYRGYWCYQFQNSDSDFTRKLQARRWVADAKDKTDAAANSIENGEKISAYSIN